MKKREPHPLDGLKKAFRAIRTISTKTDKIIKEKELTRGEALMLHQTVAMAHITKMLENIAEGGAEKDVAIEWVTMTCKAAINMFYNETLKK